MKVILIGGTLGTGKTPVASKLAKKLNIYRLISTDEIKDVYKSIIPKNQLPTIYEHDWNIKNTNTTDRIWGFLRQSMDLKPGIEALINHEKTFKNSIVLEGTHLIPGIFSLDRRLKIFHFILEVQDETLHAKHISNTLKNLDIETFSKIRAYQEYLIQTARGHNAVVINSENIDSCVSQIIGIVGKKLLLINLLGIAFSNKVGNSISNITQLYNMLPNKPCTLEAFHEKYLKFCAGELSREDFWFATSTNIDNIEMKYLETFQLNKELPEFIQNNNIEYKFAGLANLPESWIEYLSQKLNLNKYFEKIYSNVDLKKDTMQKTIYTEISKDMRIENDNIIFLDNSQENLKVAKAEGCKTIYLNNYSENDGFEPDLIVTSLKELNIKISTI